MSDQTMPDWVLLRAAKEFRWDFLPLASLRKFYAAPGGPDEFGFRALCNMIFKHEQPPVDRKMLCAREANAQLVSGHEARISYRTGIEDGSDVVKRCVRAIELYQEGFGNDPT